MKHSFDDTELIRFLELLLKNRNGDVTFGERRELEQLRNSRDFSIHEEIFIEYCAHNEVVKNEKSFSALKLKLISKNVGWNENDL